MTLMHRPMSAMALILAMGLGPQVGLAQPAAPAPVPAPASAPPAATQPAPTPPAADVLKPEQIVLLRQALEQAPAHGFPDKAFTPPGLDALLQSGDPAARLRGAALLKSAVLRYASAVHRGRLATADFDDEWGLRPAAYDPGPGYDAAIAENKVAEWLAGLPPAYAGYQQLVKALADYRAIAGKGGWQPLPAGKALKPGAVDPRVPALRARLAVEDAAAPQPPTGDPNVYDPATVQALKTFQARHGLTPDGEMGKPTLAALNAPVGQRILQITANMERWRWLPTSLPADRVQVNIAAAVMTLYKGDEPVLSMRTATGKPDDHTPMLQSKIHSIVFNPPWNVPDSIAKKELYPKQASDPGYFEREDIHVIKTAEGERLQQAAGPKSSLGQLKFDFDNRYGVYLHDTPSRGAFAKQGRLVSHGCVRLEKPQELAGFLLDGEGTWSGDLIQATIAEAETKRVALAKPVSVLIFYWTAFAGADGAVNFRGDPYDWDHELLQRISGKSNGHA
jgi:murein L,D-transpeptidase YcbB/YkuD